MNFDAVRAIADAVLYEGYILYPYRPTSAKNRQRWTFGGVYPQHWHQASDGADPCHLQSQCLIQGSPETVVEARLRFLQPVARELGAWRKPPPQQPRDADATGASASAGESDWEAVDFLDIDGRRLHRWQEATEREICMPARPLQALAGQGLSLDFGFDAGQDEAPLDDAAGHRVGVLIHRRVGLRGRLHLRAEVIGEGLWRLTLRADNLGSMPPRREIPNREEASLYSFASSHLLLGCEDGAFVSLIDPPDALAGQARACRQEGVWPVLAGGQGSRDRLLCSPIILYDYPQVAPESPGDLFDGTEIDEILSLNILAMTDEEKREMAAADPRAAQLLSRTEALGPEDFMRLHGVLRKPHDDPAAPSPAPAVGAAATSDDDRHNHAARGSDGSPQPDAPASAAAAESTGPRLACIQRHGQRLKVGDRVRLHPRAGGDVMDLVLDGRTAIIESIERDFEDRLHIAVAIDDDPGREWGLQRMPGHRFFYAPEEIEPLDEPAPPPAAPETDPPQSRGPAA